jgi:D-serine ammonia-lyase
MSLLSFESVPDLRTPAFIVELSNVRSNAARMLNKAQNWGIQLRPHVKTHKTKELARIQVDPNFGGITVSTMAEALYFAEAGFEDITYAFPLGVDKISDAWSLAEKISFGVTIDHQDTLAAITAYPSDSSSRLGVWIKLDTGANRAGLQVRDPKFIDLTKQILVCPRLQFLGVLTHAGQSYTDASRESLLETAVYEAESLRLAAKLLHENGIDCPGLSLGSTPVASINSDPDLYTGITEMRPGNYLFYDRYMAESGHCTMNDVACFVATRIVGLYPERNLILVDAGALAMSKDRGPTHLSAYNVGYGIVRDYPDLEFERLSQEHGMIRCTSGFDRFNIGTVLEIIPNHSCLTAAMFPNYHLIENGEVIGTIHPVRGW